MKQNTYNKVSGLVFAIVAIAHAVRAFNGWEVNLGPYEVPLWASWVVVLCLGWFSYSAFKLNK
jgi:hypothetical protein